MSPVDVLVVGAGPVGMALALQAHRHGARVLLVEQRAELVRPSRAMLLWPRTLEALDRLGVADELGAHPAAQLRTHVHLGRHVVAVALSDLAVPGHSQPPLMVRQAFVEDVLRRAVGSSGTPPLPRTELVGLRVEGAGAVATLTTPQGPQDVWCRFIVGCDGADSAVRRLVGIPWRGRTYPQEAVLADLDADGLERSVAHIGAGRAGIGFLFPAGEHGAGWRLVATRVARGDAVRPGRDGPAVPVPEIQSVLQGANLPGRVADAAWSTRVRLQHRRAARYRVGPVFLAGDAAHVFSPAGAQGVNTGLQDATNLGWKLAAAVQGSTRPQALLVSYEAERRPVAQQVGVLTELLLRGEGDGRVPFRLARTQLLPAVAPAVPALLRLRPLTAVTGWVLSQDWVRYPASPVTEQPGSRHAGRLRPGRIAPDLQLIVEGQPVGLHHLTNRPGVHVLHGPAVQPAGPTDMPAVWMHRVDTWPPPRILAVRPDGYIGYRDDSGQPEALYAWLRMVTGTATPAEKAGSR